MEWYIPILMFAARICDVSIGTIRMIVVINGRRWTAAALGFAEVVIWALAVGGVIRYLDNPLALVGYAGGFSTGTLVGMWIEDRIALGLRVVQVINPDRSINVASALRERDYRVTQIEGVGLRGAVEIAYSVVRRRKLDDVMTIIGEVAPNAFVTIERAERATGFDQQLSRNHRPAWKRPASMRK